jgi:hypothetical protein
LRQICRSVLAITFNFGQSPVVTEALDYALTTAPDDGGATLRWLVAQGAVITDEQGGRGEAFGNILVRFELGDAELTITRDRDQWLLDVQSGQLSRFDFDVIHVALAGDDYWEQSGPGALPAQLPDGVSWLSELPQTLNWLRTTPDAEARLKQLQQKRATQLFG